jgi:hypothetical protein
MCLLETFSNDLNFENSYAEGFTFRNVIYMYYVHITVIHITTFYFRTEISRIIYVIDNEFRNIKIFTKSWLMCNMLRSPYYVI